MSLSVAIALKGVLGVIMQTLHGNSKGRESKAVLANVYILRHRLAAVTLIHDSFAWEPLCSHSWEPDQNMLCECASWTLSRSACFHFRAKLDVKQETHVKDCLCSCSFGITPSAAVLLAHEASAMKMFSPVRYTLKISSKWIGDTPEQVLRVHRERKGWGSPIVLSTGFNP